MVPPLSRGTCPEQAGLDSDELSRIVPELDRWLSPAAGEPARPHPWCAGAVVLAGRGPAVALHEALGWAVRYRGYDAAADRGVALPADERVPMRPDTVFDLASLTKLFTAAAAVQQVERGTLALDAPVADVVPELRAAAAHGITLRHLLTHTSGLRPELPLYDLPGPAERARALAGEEPLTPPGAARRYSDLNLLLTQTLLERVTGRPLDRLVAEGITGPLGMTDTRWNPPASWRPRIAATEDQRRPWGKLDRGMVHGAVHDENAYALGGVAGHAGLFSTAWDLALFARALLDGDAGILAPASVDLLFGRAPGPDGRPAAALGFETDQEWFMGELAGRGAVGHTGFTGTSLVLDPDSGAFLILLANSVHPTRTWPLGSAPRAAAATRLARALK
ncbi:serine hydrolase domain-containing protein [Actinacidiphila acididurans]|uniref:Beta-lactamase family protein n=1 Tax=Actinacidiphila acididurans TaxID=2784346 RepID=A0ABS2TX29_9ACTN|nr:serine hydrolase domain-containing protein [Actinacidiphila acididurans]MBM9507899.1 beta-lactamase family protein [Actinacidiphila acididurans]